MDLSPNTFSDTPGPGNQTNSPRRDSLLYLDLEPKANVSRFFCQVCNKPTLSCCTECRSVFYCSPEHQLLHWSTHQYECKPPEDLNSVFTRSVLKFDTTSRKTSIIGRDRATSKETNEEIRRKDNVRKATEKSDIMDKSAGPEINETEEDSSNEGRNEAMKMGSNQNLTRRERTRKLHEVLRCYMKLHQDQASLKARKLLEIAKELFETDEEDIFEFLGDGLLLVKCLLNAGNIQGARENLVDLWKISLEYVSDKKIECKDENNKVGKLGFVHLKRGLKNFVDLASLSPRKKQEVNIQIQKTTNLFSAFAVLFYTIGDFKNCEQAYIRYVKIIEANFGGDSFECSNCYFLMGVFYLEQRYYIRAMACFKRALKIRLQRFGDEMHEPIADCYYNMAIIYKQTLKPHKAMSHLNAAFKIRVNLIGEYSLPVAQVLELVAKILLAQEDYRTTWTKLQECLLIRRKILTDDSHPDIQRVKVLIQELTQIINTKLHDRGVPYGKRETLFQLQKEIDGKKSFQDYRTGITGVSEILKTKEPMLAPKVSIPAEYNGIEEDENKSPSKIATSMRMNDFLDAAVRSQEFETLQKSETQLEKSLSKNSVPKGLNFNRIRSSTKTDQETDPHETSDKNLEVASNSTKNDRSPVDSVKRATFGAVAETELLSQNILKADMARLASSPNINLYSPNQSSAKSGGVRKPTKSVTTMMDRGYGGGMRRASDNTNDKLKGRKLNLPEDFVESLTIDQTALLGQLNATIKGNIKDRLDVIVGQSDFFRCLLNDQKEEFLMLNPELGLGQNT